MVTLNTYWLYFKKYFHSRLFEDDLIAKMEEFACEKVNSVISESLQKYESSMLNKEYNMPLTTGKHCQLYHSNL